MKTFYSFCLVLILLATATSVNAQAASQTYNVSGTFVVPAGTSALVAIEAWGAGGGGGSGAAERGGGGGGAYATLTTALAAGSYTIIVGTGGGVGAVGGASSFFNLVPVIIVSAGGGGSTTTTTGGAAGTVATGSGFSGGVGGNAGNSNSAGGGGGGSATSSANGGNGGTGANGNNALGGIGGTGQGNGGAGSVNTNAASAVAGTAPGGGGGGRASNTTTSAAGAAGRVIVTVINGTLPVKLSNIKAYEKQAGVQIDWTAYSEENLSHYQVERSSNGAAFTSLGDVTASNVTVETKYGFFDANPLPGVSYYRLKSIDIDSKYGYSPIVKVSLDKRVKNISLYPNPATGDFVSFQSSDLNKGNYQVRVFNSSGAQVFEQNFSHSGGTINQTLKLPVGIQSGLYSLKLSNDGVMVMNKTFMIQK